MPKFCVPPLSSLPGSPASDFDWWVDSTPDIGLIRYYPDNPNWLGAFGLSAGDGANEDVKFRCLKGSLLGKNYLFLQWIVRTSTLSDTIDRVNVLIGKPGGRYLAFNAKLNDASSTSTSPPGTENDLVFTYSLQDTTLSGGNITATGPQLSGSAQFEETARMWVSVTSPTRNLQTDWAFQVAIELGVNWGIGLDAAVNLPVSGDLKIWFEVWSSILGMAVPQQWPTTAPQTTGVLDIIPPSGITEGQMLDLTTGTTCDEAVKLSSLNVGTRNSDGTARTNNHTIQLDLGKDFPPNIGGYPESHTPDASLAAHQNQFFAKPTVTGLSNAQKQALKATWSIANWGSQYSEPGTASWRPIDRGKNVLFDLATNECHVVWPLQVDVGAPGSFLVNLVRNINRYLNAQFDGVPFPPGSQSPHQCMLVELSSNDPSVVITTTSIYKNMNFANASTFRRHAEISVAGAPPISEKPRDVYLYVQKFNMPPVVKKEDKPPTATVFNRDVAGLAATQVPHGNEVEDVAALVPTYTVHSYMDTGKKLKLADGSQVPILRRQTGFGYFVLHEGDLVGWEARLYGAEKLAENVYVVRVPNNGSVHVETVIQARESEQEAPLPPDGRPIETHPPKHGGCLGALFGKLFGHKKKY